MNGAGELQLFPFRGSLAVASGLVTWGQLRGPAFCRLLPDVYVAADLPLDHQTRCQAALVYAGSSAAISGVSAGVLLGAPIGRDGDPVEVTLPRRRRIRDESTNLSIIRTSLPREHMTSVLGLRATSPVRTVFDLAKRVDRDLAVIAAESFLRRNLTSRTVLETFVADRAGMRGARLLATALSLAEPHSESPMETRCRLVLIDDGLPPPTVQVKVFDACGHFVARLDMAYEEWKIGIEYEGDHRRGRRAFQDDMARLNALATLGWVIIRVGPRGHLPQSCPFGASDQEADRRTEPLGQRNVPPIAANPS